MMQRMRQKMESRVRPKGSVLRSGSFDETAAVVRMMLSGQRQATSNQRREKPMRMRVISVIAVLSVIAAIAFAGQGSNPPWFPSLMAFEHCARGAPTCFGGPTSTGWFGGKNVVNTRVWSNGDLTPYNVVYLSARTACSFMGAGAATGAALDRGWRGWTRPHKSRGTSD